MKTKKTKATILHVKDHSAQDPQDMLMEVDWATRKDVRVIKTKIGRRTYHFDKGDLWKALFILCKEDEQVAMLPSKMQKSRVYKKRVTIEATNDIKKGELVTFTVDWTLPEAVLPDDVLKQEAKPDQA